MPDNKNIGKLFSKYELLFLLKANSSSDRSQILILQFSIPRASLLLSPSRSPAETPLQHNPHHVRHWFPYLFLSYSTTHHHNYWMLQTIYQAKSIIFIITLYTDHNDLQVKHGTHQKGWVFKSYFSFIVRQHRQQQFYRQYKIC